MKAPADEWVAPASLLSSGKSGNLEDRQDRGSLAKGRLRKHEDDYEEQYSSAMMGRAAKSAKTSRTTGKASKSPTSSKSNKSRKRKTSSPTPSLSTQPPKCSPIVDVAVGRPDLSELVKAVKEAELDDVLKGEGPFTVFGTCSYVYLENIFDILNILTALLLLVRTQLNSFSAPNNQAFADLDPKPNSTEELTSVLTYHVIVGEKLSRNDLRDSDSIPIETLNGATIVTSVPLCPPGGCGGQPQPLLINRLTTRAEVIEADIDACNGVIHIIDKVLLPPDPEQR